MNWWSDRGTLCCFPLTMYITLGEVSSNFQKHGPWRHYSLSWTCRSRKNTWSPYLLKTNSYYVEIGGIASITFKQMLMFYLDPTLHQNLNCWSPPCIQLICVHSKRFRGKLMLCFWGGDVCQQTVTSWIAVRSKLHLIVPILIAYSDALWLVFVHSLGRIYSEMFMCPDMF